MQPQRGASTAPQVNSKASGSNFTYTFGTKTQFGTGNKLEFGLGSLVQGFSIVGIALADVSQWVSGSVHSLQVIDLVL